MTFLGGLRTAALNCRDRLTRHLLRQVADDLQVLLGDLHMSPTAESMRKVNCAWARAQRLLMFVQNGDDGGGASKREVA